MCKDDLPEEGWNGRRSGVNYDISDTSEVTGRRIYATRGTIYRNFPQVQVPVPVLGTSYQAWYLEVPVKCLVRQNSMIGVKEGKYQSDRNRYK